VSPGSFAPLTPAVLEGITSVTAAEFRFWASGSTSATWSPSAAREAGEV
jgi:hypothetical protein